MAGRSFVPKGHTLRGNGILKWVLCVSSLRMEERHPEGRSGTGDERIGMYLVEGMEWAHRRSEASESQSWVLEAFVVILNRAESRIKWK